MFEPLLQKVVSGQPLAEHEAELVMEQMMSGQAPEAFVGGLLTALASKGETEQEITGFARVMRRKALALPLNVVAVDTCGTGGDGKHTFNISTTAAFVVAGAGLAVAKHGNRSVSSRCGSADVLEALNFTITSDPDLVAECINQIGVGFLFAPQYHQAMKYVGGVRKTLGIRTVFNILGPLANPAGVKNQVLGVFAAHLTETLAQVLNRLGSQHALVVYGLDGLDEISLCAPTQISELQHGQVTTYRITPEQFGFKRVPPEELRGGDAQQNARLTLHVLQGHHCPQRDIVLLNAAAALVAGDIAVDMEDGIAKAALSIDRGSALAKLEQARRFMAQQEKPLC